MLFLPFLLIELKSDNDVKYATEFNDRHWTKFVSSFPIAAKPDVLEHSQKLKLCTKLVWSLPIKDLTPGLVLTANIR